MSRIGTASLVLVFATACTGSPNLSPKSDTPSASPAPRPRVAYALGGDLWLYDVSTDRVTNVEDAKDETSTLVDFIDETALGWAAGFSGNSAAEKPRIYSMTPAARGGELTEQFRYSGSFLAARWDPAGRVLVALTVNFEAGEPHTLWIVDTPGKPRVLRKLGLPLGRGADQGDKVSLSWSPDGRYILLNDTHVSLTDSGTKPTVYVMTRDGRDVVSPIFGTHATWSADGTEIFVKGFESGIKGWSSVSVPGGQRKDLPIKSTAYRLAASPGGRFLAYDDGEATPSVYVFDRTTSHERLLGSGFVAPLWIGPDRFLVTDARPCTECEGAPWIASGTATLFDVLTGASKRVALTSTLDADALIR